VGKPSKTEETRQFDAALGRRIALSRDALGMRSSYLASLLGVGLSTLSGYESGQASCPPAMLARIAEALGVTVGALMPKFVPRKRSRIRKVSPNANSS
jgi:transcriptional regulator with XRE-family HTH domain